MKKSEIFEFTSNLFVALGACGFFVAFMAFPLDDPAVGIAGLNLQLVSAIGGFGVGLGLKFLGLSCAHRENHALVQAVASIPKQLEQIVVGLQAAERRAEAADDERSALIERHATLVRKRLEELGPRDTHEARVEFERLSRDLAGLDSSMDIEDIDRLLTPRAEA